MQVNRSAHPVLGQLYVLGSNMVKRHDRECPVITSVIHVKRGHVGSRDLV